MNTIQGYDLIDGNCEPCRDRDKCQFLNKDICELTAQSLMDEHWPGPLTLLFPAKDGLSEHLTAGTGRIAVRVPGESFALCLAKKAGFPITATSANLSGMPPAENAEMVKKYFDGGIDMLIDGGQTAGGTPSTIVDVTEDVPVIIRRGATDIDNEASNWYIY